MAAPTQVAFDTNVCEALACDRRMTSLLATVRMKYRVVALPTVFSELANGLSGADGDWLKHHQNRFRAMVGNKSPEFLRMPKEFVQCKLFSLRPPVKLQPRKLRVLTERVLSASDAGTLLSHSEEIRRIANLVRQSWQAHIDVISHIRLLPPIEETIEAWVEELVEECGFKATQEQRNTLVKALPASYMRMRQLRKEYRDEGLKADRRRGDSLDVLHLFYLCDPNLIFVTCEKRLVSAASGTAQANRVVLFRDFMSKIEPIVDS